MRWYHVVPRRLRQLARPTYSRVYRQLPAASWDDPDAKYRSELAYWQSVHAQKGRFNNGHYRELMFWVAEETDAEFVRDKVVADFGCGPRGSLAWANAAAQRIGIDVLADRYFDTFPVDLAAHGMIYVRSTETSIPLPTGWVDIMFTINAMDHVDDLPAMAAEIRRTLKPGGELIGSFNIGEPPSVLEPQSLTADGVRRDILAGYEITSFRLARQGPPEDLFAHVRDGPLDYEPGQRGILWLRARRDGKP